MNYIIKRKINILAKHLRRSGNSLEADLIIRMASAGHIDFWQPRSNGNGHKPYAFRYYYGSDKFEVLRTKSGNGIGRTYGEGTRAYKRLKSVQELWGNFPLSGNDAPPAPEPAPELTLEPVTEPVLEPVTEPVLEAPGRMAGPLTAAGDILWNSDGSQKPWGPVKREVKEIIQRLEDGIASGGVDADALSLVNGLITELNDNEYFGNAPRFGVTRKVYLLGLLEGAALAADRQQETAPPRLAPLENPSSHSCPSGELEMFMEAVAGQESGGDYNALNRGTMARGRYQILETNWARWAAQSGLEAGAENTPQNQDHVARYKLCQYYGRLGNWWEVALRWYGGMGAVNGTRRARDKGPEAFNELYKRKHWGGRSSLEPGWAAYADQELSRADALMNSVPSGHRVLDAAEREALA
jgi:hypothetical protein